MTYNIPYCFNEELEYKFAQRPIFRKYSTLYQVLWSNKETLFIFDDILASSEE